MRQTSIGDFSETASHPSRASRDDDTPNIAQCIGCGKTVERARDTNPDMPIRCGDCFKRLTEEEPF